VGYIPIFSRLGPLGLKDFGPVPEHNSGTGLEIISIWHAASRVDDMVGLFWSGCVDNVPH
jgi:hypothetical protein